MSEYNYTEATMDMESNEPVKEQENQGNEFIPTGYDEFNPTLDTMQSVNIGKVVTTCLTIGAAAGAVGTKLVMGVKDKLKKHDETADKPVKEKFKIKLQMPFRSPFRKEKVLEIPVSEASNTQPETPDESQK